MPFQIIHKDLTVMECDAIVNPTDPYFSGSGGTDLAVHKAAGAELEEECENMKKLCTGGLAVTKAYKLPCRYILHTVGPIWRDGLRNEEVILRSCYLNAMLKAKKMGLTSIAFPLISSGTYGFPKDRVLRIAIDAISDFLFTADSEFQVYICILDRHSFDLSKDIALSEYILGRSSKSFIYEDHAIKMCRPGGKSENEETFHIAAAPVYNDEIITAQTTDVPKDLAEWISKKDDTFAVKLLKLIDQKNMSDVDCYKKANVTKGTFWKINNDPKYRPSKQTVIAFAIALKLNYEETESLLKTVGMTLSDSRTFDKIIQFYILNGIYDIYEINAALFQYDQVCLGC